MAKGFDGLKDWNIQPTKAKQESKKVEQTTVNKQPIQENYDDNTHAKRVLYVILIFTFVTLMIVLNSR